MGQRLSLGIRKHGKIIKKSKVIANAYYHWSGYTSSSYSLVKSAYEYLVSHTDEEEFVRCVRALESTGAGMDELELKAVHNQKDYAEIQFNPAIDRDEGLIAISKKGKKNIESWAEEKSYIDIDNPSNPKICFFVVWKMDENTYRKDYGASDDKIVDYNFDPDKAMNFTQFDKYANDLIEGKAVRYKGRIYIKID